MKKCRYKKVETVIKYHGYDWSNLILDGVDLQDKDISNIKLPDDIELFQRIKNKSVFRTCLPRGDYSKYNFDGVWLSGCKFTSDSVFSSDKKVFQKIAYKNLYDVYLSSGDYRLYNFLGVGLKKTIFTSDSLLPEYEDFLKDISFDYDTMFPDNVIRNIHNYDLDGVKLNLNKDEYNHILTQKQLDIIKNKYPEAIGKNIKLPSEVFGEDESINYNF